MHYVIMPNEGSLPAEEEYIDVTVNGIHQLIYVWIRPFARLCEGEQYG
jgi:hypothetical protein